MGKYAEDAKELLGLVGGKENIAAVSHCITRMRFALVDPAKADIQGIEAMKVVKGSFTQSGQFQVIIGNTVAEFYQDFVKTAGIEGVSKDAVKQAAKKNQNLLQRMVTALAEIFAPLIPAILAAFTLVYLEKFFRKITPQVVSMIVVPFCSLLLAVMASHFVLGPVGWKIGSAVSAVVYAGITGSFKVVFGAVFGLVYAPLVITGLHHMSNAIDLQLIADYGGTMLWPMIALSNIAQGSAVMGMILLQRKNAQAQEVNVPAGISCYLGVTEPAIFGVNLKQGFPFVCGMIGSALAAVVCVATSTTANAIGVGGLPGILSIQPEYMGSFALCMLIAIVVSLGLTVMIGRKKLMVAEMGTESDAAEEKGSKTGEDSSRTGEDSSKTEEKSSKTGENSSRTEPGNSSEPGNRQKGTGSSWEKGSGKQERKELKACLSGRVIPLKEVGDGVFSEGIMGDGIAIIPENGTLLAPVDAEVAALMEDSKHACGLRMADGMEILLHIGLDTVNMKGDGFSYMVKLGQKVKAGDPLIRFDRKKIQEAGYRDVTVCIISAPGEAKNMQFITGIEAKAGETTVAAFE